SPPPEGQFPCRGKKVLIPFHSNFSPSFHLSSRLDATNGRSLSIKTAFDFQFDNFHSLLPPITMVAILSTPKPPISSIPRRPPSNDWDSVYRTTVEPDLEAKVERQFRWTAVILYTVLVLICSIFAVYYYVQSSTIDILIPRSSPNQSLSMAHHRVTGKLKDSNIHFVQISFYAMARFRHPGNDITVDSITVSVHNGNTRVGGVQYRPAPLGEYPVIHTYGDTTEIAMLPKATLLEGEFGYTECSSMHTSHISFRLFYSILVHKTTFFGNEINGRIEYSQVYTVCCSCEMKDEYKRPL
ncbi:hypothetical protein PFISCL1PPCAC_19524, partial [Pristionchus fissidentatus]